MRAATLDARTRPVRNLVPNPSFEVDTSGWTENTGNDLVLDGSWSASGEYAAMTTNNGEAYRTHNIRSVARRGPAVVPGRLYTALLSAHADRDEVQFRFTLRTHSETGTEVQNQEGSLVPPGVHRATIVPVGTELRLWAQFIGVPPGGSVWIDAVMLVEGQYEGLFADGDTTGWAWSGVRGDSASAGPGILARRGGVLKPTLPAFFVGLIWGWLHEISAN